MKDQNPQKYYKNPEDYEGNYYYPERIEPQHNRYLVSQEYFYPAPMNEYLDEEQLKIIWKKEKNRLAAKKSREKKLCHIKELEKRELRSNLEIKELKEAIEDYDRILKNMFDYVKQCITKKDKKNENLVFLFDCLCRLKKQTGDRGEYLKDIGYMFDHKLNVSNEDVEQLAFVLRDSLNAIFDNK